MYTKTEKPQLRKFWQILIVVFITLSIPLGLVALKIALDMRSKANPTETPQEVVVSNITSSRATVSFTTPNTKTQAVIKYGKTVSGEFDKTAPDTRPSNNNEGFHLHNHDLANLDPQTDYSFEIIVGDQTYSNDSYTFTTVPIPSDMLTPNPINGRIDASDFEEGIVYVHLSDGQENSLVVSSLVPESGNYALDLATATKKNGTSFSEATNVVVFANILGKGRGFVTNTRESNSFEKIVVSQETNPYNPESLAYLDGEDDEVITPTPTLPTEEPTPVPTMPPVLQPTNPPTPIPTPIPINYLQITNLKDGDSLVQTGIILGKARPNSTVYISTNQNQIGNTQTDNEGDWQFQIPETVPTGFLTLTITNEEETITLNINIKTLDDLPETSIQDFIVYIPGIIMLCFGIYLAVWTQSNSQKKSNLN